MKVFLDTNVLIAASVRQHPHFLRADTVLRACMSGEVEGIVHTHSLLEFHSAITQLPGGLAVPPAQVRPLLAEGVLPHTRLVAMSPGEVEDVQKRASELGLAGGMVYDLFHLAVAEREEVDHFFTFNVRHFLTLASRSLGERIVAP